MYLDESAFQIAVLEYRAQASVLASFTSYDADYTSLVHPDTGETSSMNGGLRYVQKRMLNASMGHRDGVNTVIVIFADDASTDSSMEQLHQRTTRLYEAGASYIAGVAMTSELGDSLLNDQMEFLASDNLAFEVASPAMLDLNLARQIMSATVCPTASVPATTVAPSATPITCFGRRTDEAPSQSCGCNANCHSCDFSDGTAGECIRCKNSQVLFAGECVDETACPSGNVLGNGRFDRVCIMPEVLDEPEDTDAPDLEEAAVTCFGRLTDEAPAQTCGCNADCHSCDFSEGTAGECIRCKNSQVLFAGECVDETACPSGNVLGNGRFDRVCIMPEVLDEPEDTDAPDLEEAAVTCFGRLTDEAPAQTCGCNADCHSCDFSEGTAGECIRCKNSQVLFAGECVDESACPSGNVLGSGRFDRVCVMPAEAVEDVITTTEIVPEAPPLEDAPADVEICRGRATDSGGVACRCNSNCHTCELHTDGPSTCTKCKDYTFLLGGNCTEECPTGFEPRGSGRFGRECIGSRQRRGLEGAASGEVALGSNHSWTSVGSVLLLVVGGVGAAVLALMNPAALRRQSSPNDAFIVEAEGTFV